MGDENKHRVVVVDSICAYTRYQLTHEQARIAFDHAREDLDVLYVVWFDQYGDVNNQSAPKLDNV